MVLLRSIEAAVPRRTASHSSRLAGSIAYHVCFGLDGNLRVSEVWDSQEQLDAFGERLMPVLSEVGIEPGQPEVLEVHNIVRR